MEPSGALSDHVTDVSAVPVTTACSCKVLPAVVLDVVAATRTVI
jgi:hypothetical protein